MRSRFNLEWKQKMDIGNDLSRLQLKDAKTENKRSFYGK